jgi:hypothetical protein
MIRHSTVCASLLALGALATAPSTFADCTYPHAPGAFPDGAKATMEEMVASNKEVKQFIADADAYIKCIDDDSPAPSKDALAKMSDDQKREVVEREKVRMQRHNAAVQDEEQMRDKWHEVLTAYKEAHPK